MVKRMPSPRDVEILSSYLDNQLSTAERKRLETRLRQEPALLQELEALRRTRLMIRALPRRRAPRNFTLTPDMASARTGAAPRPMFGLFAAVAAVLLVFVLISDVFIVPEYIGMFLVPQSQPVGELAMEVNAVEMQADEASPVEMAQEEALIFPTMAPTQVEDPGLLREQPAAKEQPAQPQESGAEPVIAEAMPAPAEEEMKALESAQALGDEALSAQEGAGIRSTPAEQLTVTPGAAETLVIQEAADGATEVAVLMEEAPGQPAVDVSQAQRPYLWVQVLLWMAELLLVFLLIGVGLAALYTRTKRQT
jgi:hypothetical protein